MPKDYKSSNYRTGKPQKKLGMDGWDRLLIVVFVTVLALVVKHFIVLEMAKRQLSAIEVPSAPSDTKVATASAAVASAAKEVIAAGGGLSPEELNAEPNADPSLTPEQAKAQLEAKQKAEMEAKLPPRQDSIPVEPHFDFYTILPSVEVVIPDHEIKTRIREEKLGEGDKTVKYIMQAGSFRDSPDAESLKTKLAGMGIESRVEQAKVGEATWYRVKVGPYAGMSNIMTVKTQLRSIGVDAIVLEFK